MVSRLPLHVTIGRKVTRGDLTAALRALDDRRAVVIAGAPRTVAAMVGQITERVPDVLCRSERPEVETAPGSDERVRSERARAVLYRRPRPDEVVVLDATFPRSELSDDRWRRWRSR